MGWTAAFAAAAVGLGLAGTWRMFGHFPGYDDEGYILLTVRNYLELGGLYSRVYSQYGPAFYVLHDGLHRVTGVMVDHAFARWFTLTLWLGSAAATAGIVWRATRVPSAAWFAGVAVFLFLHQFSEEAFHPGVVVVFLLPVLLGALHEVSGRGHPWAAAALAGAGMAVLGLLKINVGALFAAALVVWVVLKRPGRWRRTLAVALGLIFAAGLMQGLIEAAWVRIFLVLVGTGLAGLAMVIAPGWPPGRGIVTACAIGAGATTAGILGAVAVRGSSWQDLLEGVIWRPLQHAGSYSYAVDWRPGTLILALASLVLLGLQQSWIRRGRSAAAERLVVGLRLLLLGGVLTVVALLEKQRVIGVLFSYAIPWLWVWVWPLARPAQGAAGQDARPLLACVLLLQTLHAYPVGGIQICWGGFLIFALVAMAWPETCAWLATRQSGIRRVARLALALPVVVVAVKAGWTAGEYHAAYARNPELGLPGTAGLRLSERETLAYRTLVVNSVLHADRLYSLPGMFSFNLWSGLPPPSLHNTTLWYTLLTAQEQREIVEGLEEARRPALVVDAALVNILKTSGSAPSGPLYDYLLANFRPVFSFQGLGFWVRQGRVVLPVGTAWRIAPDGDGFQVCLAGSDRPVAQIELRDAEQPAAGGVKLDARNSRVTIQFMNLDGTPRAGPSEATWPLQIDGPAWITIRSDEFRGHPRGPTPLLEFKAADDLPQAAALVVDAQ